MILFDVYLTWARIEKSSGTSGAHSSAAAFVDAPIILQYLFFLTLNFLATFAHHLTVRALSRLLLMKNGANHVTSPLLPESGSPDKEDLQNGLHGHAQTNGASSIDPQHVMGPGRASPSAISTALLVSSCTKLFPILLVIWPTESPESSGDSTTTSNQSFETRARSYVGWAVLLNNIEALLILLDCGYVAATVLAMAGLSARWLIEGVILGAAGLEADAGPIGDISRLFNEACRWLGVG